MRRSLSPFCLSFALVVVGGSHALAAQTILSTDFSTADVKSYTNGEAISLTGDPAALMTANMGVYDASIGHWTVDPDAANFLAQVVDAGGEHALELAGGAVSKCIPDKVSHMRGLKLEGSVVFTPLPSSVAGRPDFLILLTKDFWCSTGPSTIASLTVSQSLALKYGGNVSKRLTAGTKYRVDFAVDFNDPQQHTWEFTLYEGDGTGKPLFASGKLNTRNPTGMPNTFVLHQVARVTGADPLVRVHRVRLTIPDAGPTDAKLPSSASKPGES